MLNSTFPYTCDKGTINGQPIPSDFMEEAELAAECATVSGALDKAQWRTILAAIDSSLPVIITVRRKPGHDVPPAVERITAMVDYASVHGGGSDRLRVRYWGFGHYLWLGEIISVETPSVEWIR